MAVKGLGNVKSRFYTLFFGLLVLGCALGFYNSVATSDDDVNSQWGNIKGLSLERASSMRKLAKLLQEKGFPETVFVRELQDAGDALAAADGIEPLRLAGFRAENAIDSLMLVSENYPAIQADADFINTRKDLYEIGRNLSVARHEYNETVQAHNRKVKFFPYFVLAECLGLKEREYFRNAERSRFLPKEAYADKAGKPVS